MKNHETGKRKAWKICMRCKSPRLFTGCEISQLFGRISATVTLAWSRSSRSWTWGILTTFTFQNRATFHNLSAIQRMTENNNLGKKWHTMVKLFDAFFGLDPPSKDSGEVWGRCGTLLPIAAWYSGSWMVFRWCSQLKITALQVYKAQKLGPWWVCPRANFSTSSSPKRMVCWIFPNAWLGGQKEVLGKTHLTTSRIRSNKNDGFEMLFITLLIAPWILRKSQETWPVSSNPHPHHPDSPWPAGISGATTPSTGSRQPENHTATAMEHWHLS